MSIAFKVVDEINQEFLYTLENIKLKKLIQNLLKVNRGYILYCYHCDKEHEMELIKDNKRSG